MWTGSTSSVEPGSSLDRRNKICCARRNKLCCAWLLIGQNFVTDQSQGRRNRACLTGLLIANLPSTPPSPLKKCNFIYAISCSTNVCNNYKTFLKFILFKSLYNKVIIVYWTFLDLLEGLAFYWGALHSFFFIRKEFIRNRGWARSKIKKKIRNLPRLAFKGTLRIRNMQVWFKLWLRNFRCLTLLLDPIFFNNSDRFCLQLHLAVT